MMDQRLTLASCYFLAGVLLYTGIDQLTHYGGFVRALNSYVLIPSGVPSYLAVLIFLLEMVAGLALLTRRWRAPAALLAVSLFALFTAIVAINYWVQPKPVCGSWFTLTLNSGEGKHVVQNLLLTGLALSSCLTERKPIGVLENVELAST